VITQQTLSYAKWDPSADRYALEILNMEFACGDELRFAVSSLRIADALQAMCRSASEIAEESAPMFDDCAEVGSEGRVKIGDLTNRFVRLCTIALSEEAIEHAELVLDRIEMEEFLRLRSATGVNGISAFRESMRTPRWPS
jgi:hypothetical protein